MSSIYRCACFAIPQKMLRKISEKALPADRQSMQDQMEAAARIRSDRHASTAAVRPAAAGPSASAAGHRIFNADASAVLPGQLLRRAGQPAVADEAANQAYDNVGITLDFYRTLFQRDSLDGRGMPVDSSVHVGKNFANAMWTGRQMVFGDGNAEISGFTAALDIIAHEITHGVTQHLVPQGLGVAKMPAGEKQYAFEEYTLRGQSGALNESISDVFAIMVKQWHAKKDAKPNWLLGEHLLAPQHGFAIRSLADPGNRKLTCEYDDQVAHMKQYEEDGDVHDNSGIPNHAFYLAVTDMGLPSWEKAGPIWYQAVSQLKADASFKDMAAACVAAASALHGAGSAEELAVGRAWKKVGVT
jgi:Zn-dependent metalloprotease